MDTESFPILTARGKGKAAVETTVVIDWTGISLDQLKTLARNSLLHDLQCKIRDEKIKPQDAGLVTLVARNEIYEPNPARLKLMPPKPKTQVMAVIEDKLEELLKGLTPEELKILLESTDD